MLCGVSKSPGRSEWKEILLAVPRILNKEGGSGHLLPVGLHVHNTSSTLLSQHALFHVYVAKFRCNYMYTTQEQ